MTHFTLRWLRNTFAALLVLVLALPLTTSCEDNAGNADNAEFSTNWKERNAQYFLNKFNEAKNSISQAKAAYGNDWEAHTSWRVARSWCKVDGRVNTTDSICFEYVERGTGSALPLYTDSVWVNYIGHLTPTESYAAGKIFDHSGVYEDETRVFDSRFAQPVEFGVSNLVEGFTTAMLYLHVGDRIRLYIPQELAYLSAASSNVPAYSTLVFDLQLKGIVRKGATSGSWN